MITTITEAFFLYSNCGSRLVAVIARLHLGLVIYERFYFLWVKILVRTSLFSCGYFVMLVSLIRKVTSKLVHVFTNEIDFTLFQDQWLAIFVHDHVHARSWFWIWHQIILFVILINISLNLIFILIRSLIKCTFTWMTVVTCLCRQIYR